MGFPRDESGKTFGNLTVLGDTGKRGKGRSVILLVRNNDTGEIQEAFADNVYRGDRYTGYIGSPTHREKARESAMKTLPIMHEKVIHEGAALPMLAKLESQPNSKTGYRGVSYDNTKQRWYVQVQIGKKKAFSRSYTDFQTAVMERNAFMLERVNPLLSKYGFEKVKEIQEVRQNRYVHEKQKEINHSINTVNQRHDLEGQLTALMRSLTLKGVSFKKDRHKWKAYVNIDRKQYHLGYFNTEEQAKAVRQTIGIPMIQKKISEIKQQLKEIE